MIDARKYKVAFVTTHLEKGGPSEHLLGLVKYLDRRIFEPCIITLYPERQNSSIEKFKELNISMYSLNLNRLNVFASVKLKKKIIQVNPDIVHSESMIADAICSMCKLKVPWMLTLHNYVYEDIIMKYGKILGNFFCYLELRAIKKSNITVSCSKTLKNKYKAIVSKNIIPIQNGIDMEKWKSKEVRSRNEMRNKLNISNETIVYISTNAIIYRKNPDILIKAFDKANIRNSVLLILGDGNLKEECMNLAKDNVIFTGKVMNVRDYLNMSDIFVSLSSSEGLPYAVLEAASCGLKMVLSDIPQHREIIREKNEYIKWASVKKINSTAEALKEISTSRIKNIVYNLEDFTAKNMSKHYQQVYFKLIEDDK